MHVVSVKSNVCKASQHGVRFSYSRVYLFLSALLPAGLVPLLFFLVLPVYCYQPVSLHHHALMLRHVTPWTQPTRLLSPWTFPGDNPGAGYHFLLLVWSSLYERLIYRKGKFPINTKNWQIFPNFFPFLLDI